MIGSLVLIEMFDDGIYSVRLNRPEKLNALSIELRAALGDHLNSLSEDPKCQGVVLTGEGTAFCAGMDFTQFGGDRENKLKLLNSTKNMFTALLRFPKPLIGAINGAAVGGGFMLALCCDERLAPKNAFFGFYEVRLGIKAPYDIVRLFVDETTAKAWCETGQRISITEAVNTGVVKAIVDSNELVGACRFEAKSRSQYKREVSAAIQSAFMGEMRSFERALFANGHG